MKHLLIIYGTRPEVINLYPLYQQLASQFYVTCFWTGQQILPQNIFPSLPTKNKWNKNLQGDLFDRFFQIGLRLNEYAKKSKDKIDGIIVQGDTLSAYVGGLYGFLNRIPVFHVEAGLRTHNVLEPFPEEYVRTSLAKLSTIHFAPTKRAVHNLLKEKVNSRDICLVGNTVVDMLRIARNKLKTQRSSKYILVTTHRKENYPTGIKNVCQAINKLSQQFSQYTFYYLKHQNPKITCVITDTLEKRDNIVLLEPLPYLEMLSLLQNADLILTDSGGLQEEAGILKIPTYVLRNTTERTEIIKSGCGKLIGCDTERIVKNVSKYLTQKKHKKMKTTKEFGNGFAGEKICKKLVDYYNE